MRHHAEQMALYADHLIKLAAAKDLPLELVDPDSYGWFTYEYSSGIEGRYPVHVHRMIFNWRISEVDGAYSYARSWCFQGVGDPSFLKAVEALKAWNCDPGSEPRGFIKSWDGRRDDKIE